MKRVFIFCIGLLMVGATAWSQTSFTVTVDRDSVLLGHYVKVSFTLADTEERDVSFEAPAFDGMEIVSGPNQSSSIKYMNGDFSRSISYTYYLKPKDVGQYYIHPASIKVGEDVLETQPLALDVFPNPDGLEQLKEPQPNSFEMPFGNFEFTFPDMKELFKEFENLIPEELFKQAPEKDEKASKPKRKIYKL